MKAFSQHRSGRLRPLLLLLPYLVCLVCVFVDLSHGNVAILEVSTATNCIGSGSGCGVWSTLTLGHRPLRSHARASDSRLLQPEPLAQGYLSPCNPSMFTARRRRFGSRFPRATLRAGAPCTSRRSGLCILFLTTFFSYWGTTAPQAGDRIDGIEMQMTRSFSPGTVAVYGTLLAPQRSDSPFNGR